jgi:hypothetical protein
VHPERRELHNVPVIFIPLPQSSLGLLPFGDVPDGCLEIGLFPKRERGE